MKEIKFANLNFNIVNSYKIMSSRIKDGCKVLLFNEFYAKVFISRNFFNVGIEFEIEKQDSSTVKKVQSVLFKTYGSPNYITNGIQKVWKEDGFYITHGMQEKYYKKDVHILKISFFKPYTIMLEYEKYDKYQTLFNNLCDNWGLIGFENLVAYNDDKSFMINLSSEGFDYLVLFNRKKFAIYSRERIKVSEGIKSVPHTSLKGRYKSIEDLYNQLNSFFIYLEEYDLTLKRTV